MADPAPHDLSEVPDAFGDLLDAPVGVLATVGPSGIPQLSNVWFLVEDDQLRISLNTSRQKTKNLEANPGCTLLVSDPSGYRYLEVRGQAELVPDPDYALADRVGAKYGGADLREMDGPGESRVAVTVHPTRVRPVDMAAGG